jgi:hypothetical protein
MRTRKAVLLVASTLALSAVGSAGATRAGSASALPAGQIERALQAKGTVSQHVLSIEIDRSELGLHRIHDVPVTASFQINGALTFQPLTGGRVLFNGDIPLQPSEVDRFPAFVRESQSDATRPLDETSEGIAVENVEVPRQPCPDHPVRRRRRTPKPRAELPRGRAALPCRDAP